MKFIVPAVLAIATLSGCASIMNGKTQNVTVSASDGSKISGTVDGKPFVTPGAVEVSRTNNNKIFLTDAEGCDKQTTVEKSVSPVFFGNIILGGLFGSTTDYSTDRMWKYSENVTISCKK